MAQLLDIQKVVVAPDALRATVRVSEGAPLRTSEDIEGTARVYWLLPEIADHVCLGAGGSTFRDVMGDTDIAHMMEHVTLELISRTNLGGDLSNARTVTLEAPRTYEIELACPDDVLVTACLSSAGWILQWAYGSADEENRPSIDGIVAGIMNLVSRSYTMEGNEAPLPGTEPEVVEESVTEEVVGDGARELVVEDDEVTVDVARPDDGVREATRAAIRRATAAEAEAELGEAEEANQEVFEAENELEGELGAEPFDELAAYDLVMVDDEPEDVIDAVEVAVSDDEREPVVTEIGGEVGFIDLGEDDPLADNLA